MLLDRQAGTLPYSGRTAYRVIMGDSSKSAQPRNIRRSRRSSLTHRRRVAAHRYLDQDTAAVLVAPVGAGYAPSEGRPCRRSMRVIAAEASTSTLRVGMTTVMGSSLEPVDSLQSSAAGISCRAASGPAGGAGDERSPSRAATAWAARRSAKGSANPVAAKRRAKGLPEKLSILGGPGPGAARWQEREPATEGAG
jgi:hypothetical protein